MRYENKQTHDLNFLPVMEYVLIYAKDKSSFFPNLPFEQYSCDKFIYEIIEKSLEMWLEERIDCTNF